MICRERCSRQFIQKFFRADLVWNRHVQVLGEDASPDKVRRPSRMGEVVNLLGENLEAFRIEGEPKRPRRRRWNRQSESSRLTEAPEFLGRDRYREADR